MRTIGETNIGIHIALRIHIDTLKVEDLADRQNDLVLDGSNAGFPLVFVVCDGCIGELGCEMSTMLQDGE
jgi:hypothetical protein